MKYIINNTIVFSPGEGLYLVTSDVEEFKLSLLSDRILFLLVTLKGTTISKQEIHNYLWKEFSLDVSSASINNNLSYLRKFFKQMGVSDFIVTIPKVGVSIKQGTCIESFDQEYVPERGENILSPPVILKRQKGTNKKKWLLSGGATICFVTLFFLLANNNSPDSIRYIDSIQDCKIFSLENLSATESGLLMTSAKAFIDDKVVACTKDRVVIASSQGRGQKYVRGNRDFFALCEMHETHLYSCDNYYYLGGVR